MELEPPALEVLQQTGIRKSHTVLDFDFSLCMHTIQAAKIVGEKGKVYALAKAKESLVELMQKARRMR